ncbi:MAG: thermonuclease family protein [Thermoleophilia bacterium]|jgi:micrococcal nuclease
MTRRSPLVIVVALLLAIIVARLIPVPHDAPVVSSSGPIAAGPAIVLDVLDGDTIRVRMAGYEGPVRIVGVDTPEIEHPGKPAGCFGEQAAAATRAWLLGRTVEVTPAIEQRDRYDRLLARVVPPDGPISGRDLARTLALSGFARELPIAPNTDDAPAIAAEVRSAQRHGRGLWSACGFAAAFPGKESGSGG